MAEQRQVDQLETTYSSVNTGCSPEDLLEAMDDKEGGERGSAISVQMA